MRENYMEQHVKAYREMEILKNSSVEFNGLVDIDDLLESMEQYIRDIGIEYFYLCTCGSLDNAMEMIRKQDMMKAMLQRLNKKLSESSEKDAAPDSRELNN
ncbi:MAG: hypothetical protein HDR04_09610 [Lachnospiraceae bacterium]|nr:hypothetical protein [Lachnospiraceae bacterium]